MSDELNRVYEALQKADQAGNVEDAKQLASYARQLEESQKETASEAKNKEADANVRDIIYPGVGAVAGSTLGGASGAGRMLYGGAKAAAKLANPEAMAMAKLQADKNAVETWARTQNRVPGMVAEKPGLYFGEPKYELEAARAKEEIAKMKADPAYHAKVLETQKPSVAAYEKRVAAANPSTMQKVGRVLSKAPMDFIAGPLAGLGAGFQASDAVNRWDQGDKLGSIISGIGAAGSAASIIPHPATRLGGTAIGLGAEGLNAYIDFLKKNNPFDKLQQAQPQQAQPQQMATGGKVKPLSKAQKAMKHFAGGGLTSAPTISSGQFTAAPSPAPMAPPMPQGMPTPEALQAWQNAGSPSNHNFFGSDTPNGPMPEPQVFTGGHTAPTPEMKPGLPVLENDLEFMAKRGLSPNGQPPEPQVFTGGYTAPTPQVQPATPMYGFGNDTRFMDQLPTQTQKTNPLPQGTSPLPRPQPSVVSQREQVMAAQKARQLEKMAQQKAERQAYQQRILQTREAQRQKTLAEQQARKQKLLDSKNQIKTGSYTAPVRPPVIPSPIYD